MALIPPSVKKPGAARTDSFDFSQSATTNGVGCTTSAVNYAYDTVAAPMVFAVSDSVFGAEMNVSMAFLASTPSSRSSAVFMIT